MFVGLYSTLPGSTVCNESSCSVSCFSTECVVCLLSSPSHRCTDSLLLIPNCMLSTLYLLYCGAKEYCEHFLLHRGTCTHEPFIHTPIIRDCLFTDFIFGFCNNYIYRYNSFFFKNKLLKLHIVKMQIQYAAVRYKNRLH